MPDAILSHQPMILMFSLGISSFKSMVIASSMVFAGIRMVGVFEYSPSADFFRMIAKYGS